jgi:putative ABC transport system substrate-binding protein
LDHRKRRLSRLAFVSGAGAVSLGLLAGCGRLPFQQAPPTSVKVHRVGVLRGNTPYERDQELDLLQQALGDLGYVPGRNLAIEYCWDADYGAQLAAHAAELIRLPVEVLVALSVPGAVIAHQVSTTVPIVVAGPGDPVDSGLAARGAHPGGMSPG